MAAQELLEFYKEMLDGVEQISYTGCDVARCNWVAVSHGSWGPVTRWAIFETCKEVLTK